MKKNIDALTEPMYTRRLVYISCHSWLTVDTYLEPLQSDKKDKKQIKKDDKFTIMNPLSNCDEVQVDSVSPNGTFCNISRINLNKVHEFTHKKSNAFIEMIYDIRQGKIKIQTDILRNQLFCRRKKTVTRFYCNGYRSDELHPKKE